MPTNSRAAATAVPATSRTNGRAARLIRRRQKTKRRLAALSLATLGASAIVLFVYTTSALSAHHSPARASPPSGAQLPVVRSGNTAATNTSTPETGGAPHSVSRPAPPVSSAAAARPVPPTSSAHSSVPAAFDGHACSLAGVDEVTRLVGQPVTAAATTDGSNGCEYRQGGRVLASVTIDRGSTGGPATLDDLHQLVDGMSGKHTNIPKLGDAATLIGDQQSAVLFVLAKGWTLQVVASTSSSEQQVAQTAVAAL